MKVILGYSRYGVEIDVPKEASKDEMIIAYLRTYGGPESILNHFLRHVSFIEDTISDATIIEESKNKFNNELTFIEPAWEFPSSNIVNTRERFEAILGEAEANYMELITLGFKPQEARAVLPNALKTEIVVTGFIDDWKHFFELRCDSAAHPDIRKLALDLQKQFIDREFI